MNNVYKSYEASGYNLYELPDNAWALDVKGGELIVDTYKNIVTKMFKMGFEQEEMETAIAEMVFNGDNAANFGMRKSFIYSFKKEFDKKAS